MSGYGGSGDTSGFDSVQAYHIMQIGVNIIDQARADNFPPRSFSGSNSRDVSVNLTTGKATSVSAATGTTRAFYGVKILPYINRIIDTFVRILNANAITNPVGGGSSLSNSDINTQNTPFPGKVYPSLT